MNAKDHFSGDWKLNLRKSQFAPGHHPTNGIMHWEQTAEGYRMTAQKTGDNGQIVEERPLNVILDGKEHLIPDLPGWSAMMPRRSPAVMLAGPPAQCPQRTKFPPASFISASV